MYLGLFKFCAKIVWLYIELMIVIVEFPNTCISSCDDIYILGTQEHIVSHDCNAKVFCCLNSGVELLVILVLCTICQYSECNLCHELLFKM